MADFAANLYTGFDAGRKRAIDQRDMQRSEQINALLGQAYADPNLRQQALADISRIAPDVAFKAEEAFSGQGDRRTAQIGNLSRTYLAMPAAARGKFAQQYAQDFQRLNLNPADPDFEGIATGYAQAGGEGRRVQSSKIGLDGNIYNIMQDGEIVNTGVQADRQAWMRDIPGYAPEIIREGGQVIPVGSPMPTAAPGPSPEPNKAQSALDAIGAQLGFQTTSAVRSPAENAALPGSAPNSQHVTGTARDYSVAGKTPEQVATLVGALKAAGFEVITRDHGTGPHVHAELPPQTGPQGGPAIRPTAAADAGAAEAAKIRAQQEAAPRQAEIDANAARATEVAKAAGQREIGEFDRKAAYDMFETGILGLQTGLEGTETGVILGNIPAMTSGAQSAEGAIALFAPILKQLFRQAGEGTFTKDDQASLLAMLPTRADYPDARERKINGVRAIVRQKLGLPDTEQPPVPGARKAPDGLWYVLVDGKYSRVDL